MKKTPTVSKEILVDKILYIRNQKVMLDYDLASLYGTTTKRVNEQVKRNKDLFPNNFMFQLILEEKEEVVANCDHLENLKFSKTLPHAFTEHGTLMLANVLRSEKAISASILIEKIKKKLGNHDKNIELVSNYLKEMTSKKEPMNPRKRIGYKS
jgi:hypothetical protein